MTNDNEYGKNQIVDYSSIDNFDETFNPQLKNTTIVDVREQFQKHVKEDIAYHIDSDGDIVSKQKIGVFWQF